MSDQGGGGGPAKKWRKVIGGRGVSALFSKAKVTSFLDSPLFDTFDTLWYSITFFLLEIEMEEVYEENITDLCNITNAMKKYPAQCNMILNPWLGF